MIGVINKYKVWYYSVGISFWFMCIGFLNYVMRKGVKVIYFIFFILKYFGVCMIVESNILLDDIEFLELKMCWFEGVSCWELMSVEGKDWK